VGSTSLDRRAEKVRDDYEQYLSEDHVEQSEFSPESGTMGLDRGLCSFEG
jgi:hypothetical protein